MRDVVNSGDNPIAQQEQRRQQLQQDDAKSH